MYVYNQSNINYSLYVYVGSGKQVAAGQTSYIDELRYQHNNLEADDSDILFEYVSAISKAVID